VKIKLGRKAARFLKRQNDTVKERIRNQLVNLRKDPVPHDAKFLGRDGPDRAFRIRIGQYRVLYSINHERVLVFTIEKRERAY